MLWIEKFPLIYILDLTYTLCFLKVEITNYYKSFKVAESPPVLRSQKISINLESNLKKNINNSISFSVHLMFKYKLFTTYWNREFSLLLLINIQ